MFEITPALYLPLYLLQWVAILFLVALVLGAYNQIGRLSRDLNPPATQLARGDRLPVEIGLELPQRAFVLLMSHGCGPCSELGDKLQDIDVGGWAIAALVAGERPVDGSSEIPVLTLPDRVRVLEDRDRVWFRQLGNRSTPAALAFVDGRLVAQERGPNLAWFAGVVRAYGSSNMAEAVSNGSERRTDRQAVAN